MYYKTEFIVLKRINYADNDRIITLFCPYKGKINAIAKGSRKLTSKLSAGIELFTHSYGCFAKGKNLDVLTQVTILEPFLVLRSQFYLITKSLYLLELCHLTAAEGQENPILFDLLVQTLKYLQKNPQMAAESITYFEMKLLSILGFKPQLYTCAYCSKSLLSSAKNCGIISHGILCYVCLSKNNEKKYQVISLTQLKQIQKLQNIEWNEYQRCLDSFPNINQIPSIFLTDIIGKRLKTKHFCA